MKLHDANLDNYLNIGEELSTEETRTPAAVAQDIIGAEKDSDQNSSSDEDDNLYVHAPTSSTQADAMLALHTIQGYLLSVSNTPHHVFSALSAVESFLLM